MPVVDQATGNIIVPSPRTARPDTAANGGLTWSAATDITLMAKLPTWDGIALGPNHLIQLERGPNAGRIVIPSNHNLLGQNLEPGMAGRSASSIPTTAGRPGAAGGTLIITTAGIGPTNPTSPNWSTATSTSTHAAKAGSAHRLTGYSTDGGFRSPGRPSSITAWSTRRCRARSSVIPRPTWAMQNCLLFVNFQDTGLTHTPGDCAARSTSR
ncbi:MAG: sialidase family protein [Phycisphaerales bacterium]